MITLSNRPLSIWNQGASSINILPLAKISSDYFLILEANITFTPKKIQHTNETTFATTAKIAPILEEYDCRLAIKPINNRPAITKNTLTSLKIDFMDI